MCQFEKYLKLCMSHDALAQMLLVPVEGGRGLCELIQSLKTPKQLGHTLYNETGKRASLPKA